MKNEDTPHETTEPITAHSTGLGNLYAAKAEFAHLATEAGRSPAGRAYNILVTDLEKLIFTVQGFFPQPSETA